MRRSLILTAFLGAWLAGTVFMWFTAIKNFETVDAILAAPPPAVAEEADRELMRYQASEVNRLFFSGWGWVQIGIALGAGALAWTVGGLVRWLVLASVAIAGFLQALVVPETIRLGRIIDFGGGSAAETAAFWRYHHAYTGLDMLKFAMIAVVVLAILRAQVGDHGVKAVGVENRE